MTRENQRVQLLEDPPCRPPATAHLLNELQPLLDVRLPFLPLHQSLEKEHSLSVRQEGLVAATSAPSCWRKMGPLSFPLVPLHR
jgi:hypothetical protein